MTLLHRRRIMTSSGPYSPQHARNTTPQVVSEDTSEDASSEPPPAPQDGQDEILARWLAATDRAATDRTGWSLWRLYNSPTFAELWYEARAAGERIRARAVATLYAHHAHPGGRHPDPRSRVSYSERAIVAQAFRQLGIRIWPQPPCVQHDPAEQIAYLMTYHPADRMPPRVVVHAPTDAVPEGYILFKMACLLGYITREREYILDPDAPHGARFLPNNPGLREVLHQFAFAFLYVEPHCPPEWACQCNDIRRSYNQRPAEHDQPTDTLSLADLRAHLLGTSGASGQPGGWTQPSGDGGAHDGGVDDGGMDDGVPEEGWDG